MDDTERASPLLVENDAGIVVDDDPKIRLLPTAAVLEPAARNKRNMAFCNLMWFVFALNRCAGLLKT